MSVLRSFAGGRLFGTMSGDAAGGDGHPQVLALHGWARTHRDFDAVTEAGGGRPLNAMALDLPGFGATPPPPEPWGSAEYATCVAEVLADMAPRVVVLGHSFGGRVALHLAAQHPRQVRGLVLSGVPQLVAGRARRPRPRPAFRLARELHRIGLVSDARMESARQRYGSADYRAASGVMRQVLVRVLAEDYEPLLGSIDCPVALVWADDDSAAPLATAEAAATHLRSSSLTVCAGAGHLTPCTAPGELRKAVEALL